MMRMITDDMVPAVTFVSGIVLGFVLGCCEGGDIRNDDAARRFKAVGIREIRECRVDTANCQSNWYEIVWEGKR